MALSCAVKIALISIGGPNINQSILAVDPLAIQHSLTILEERYNVLREFGQERFEAWTQHSSELKQQLAAQTATLQQTHAAHNEQTNKLTLLEAEHAKLKAEHERLFENSAATEQSAAALKRQLAIQAESLQEAQMVRDEQATKLQALTAELATMKAQNDALVDRLHRLRCLGRPAGTLPDNSV